LNGNNGGEYSGFINRPIIYGGGGGGGSLVITADEIILNTGSISNSGGVGNVGGDLFCNSGNGGDGSFLLIEH
jgi:hypothetical protein